MSAPGNPQAFPYGDLTHGGREGMTLLDYFAAQAMSAMLINPSLSNELMQSGGVAGLNRLASAAYGIGIVMLQHRDRLEKEGRL